MLENLVIARLFGDHDPFFAEYPRCPYRVGAARLNIDKEQVLPVLFQRHPHIFRLTGPGIKIAARQHTADLVERVNLVGDLGGQRAGHQLVVSRLVLHLLLVLSLFKHQPGAGVGTMEHDVDFVEGEPVFHQPVEGFKAGAGVAGKELHHFTIAP